MPAGPWPRPGDLPTCRPAESTSRLADLPTWRPADVSGWCCGRMDSAWISSRFPRNKIKLKVLGATRWGRRADCLRAASFRVARGLLASPGLGSFGAVLGFSALSYRRFCPGEALRRCPTDACVPVGSLGVVLCGPPRDHCFPCASGLTGARLGAQRGTRVETVVGGTWKPNGNRVETSWKPRGSHVDFYM